MDATELSALGAALAHRGPDDAGTWTSPDGRIGFAHRRLSIIDLSPRGHQPMTTAEGDLAVVYNGEIYNYPELRRELERKGHCFRSDSDTEVLLHGWRAWRIELLDRLRGMFAFALHDVRRRETWLARDALGIKPLYWAHDAGRVLFASEVRALSRAVRDSSVDPEGVADFLMWGSIAPPRTLHRAIDALPAGHWLRVGESAWEGPEAWFRLDETVAGAITDVPPEEAGAFLRDALLDSVRRHLLADVEVGAFLSGGVDSSALVGLLAEVHDAPIRTVTLAMDAPDLDESHLARQAAALYGTDHHEIPMRIEELRERIPEAVAALDQPSVDGINTFFVSEAAVQAGLKVVVSGIGGDELFGGYSTFQDVPRLRRARAVATAGGWLAPRGAGPPGWVPRLLGARGAKLDRALRLAIDDEGAYFAIRGLFTPSEAAALGGPEVGEALATCRPHEELRRRVRAHRVSAEERVGALELGQYLQVQLLRDSDAMSMSHSLELRTPLVDRSLLEAALRVPPRARRAGPAKRHLRDAARPPVPGVLWRRRKQGFTLPFDRWIRSGQLSLRPPEHPLLRPEGVAQAFAAFEEGRLHFSRVWALHVLGRFLAAS